jgi:hypothetical protein
LFSSLPIVHGIPNSPIDWHERSGKECAFQQVVFNADRDSDPAKRHDHSMNADRG